MELYDIGDKLTAKQNKGAMDVPFTIDIKEYIDIQAEDFFCQKNGQVTGEAIEYVFSQKMGRKDEIRQMV